MVFVVVQPPRVLTVGPQTLGGVKTTPDRKRDDSGWSSGSQNRSRIILSENFVILFCNDGL